MKLEFLFNVQVVLGNFISETCKNKAFLNYFDY